MTSIEKLLWYIEVKLDTELDLECLSQQSQLSPFALSRLFTLATGGSVMRYVRARRLSRAANALINGAPDILQVALDAGYSSHEAFTRAFRELFGVTPKDVRAQRDSAALKLVEPLRMKDISLIDLDEPRFEQRPAFIIAGMGDRFSFDKNEGIVELWQAVVPYLGQVPGQVGYITYGLCCHPQADGSFEYVAGVEVSHTRDLPAGFRSVSVAAQQYAVFRHKGHISTIHQTFFSIFNQWLPNSGYEAAQAPEFEQYSDDFDPSRNQGYVEIWLPVCIAAQDLTA